MASFSLSLSLSVCLLSLSLSHTCTHIPPHTILFFPVLYLLHATLYTHFSLSGCCPTSLSSPFISLAKTGTGRLRRGRVLGEPFFLPLCDGRVTVSTAEPSLCWVWSLERLQSSGGKVSLRECLHYRNTDIVKALVNKCILIFDSAFQLNGIFQNPFSTKGSKLIKVYQTIERAYQLTNRLSNNNEENGKYAKNQRKHYSYRDSLINMCMLRLQSTHIELIEATPKSAVWKILL